MKPPAAAQPRGTIGAGECGGQTLRGESQRADPSPGQQLEGHVVPEGDEREDGEDVPQPVGASSERDIDVADAPTVERAVPVAPEAGEGEVVAHAAPHILRELDAVQQRP